MRRSANIANILVLLCLSTAILFGQASTPTSAGAPGQQTQAAFVCAKEKDPFASFCTDINNFLSRAAKSKGLNHGKIDRADDQVRSALRSFLMAATSIPDRFTSLQTQVALQNALGTISSGQNQNRPDQQVGAGTDTSGTTSLVQKVGTPAILAFALESGALTRSVSGNTATLNANADGLLRAFTGQPVLCFDCPETHALGTTVLKNINLSAAFAVNQQGTSSVATSGAANSDTPSSISSIQIPTSTGKLSGFTVRYELRNRFDPRDNKFRSAWNDARTRAKTQIDDKSKALQLSLQDLLVQAPVKTDLDSLQAVYEPLFYDDADAGDLASLRKHFLNLYAATVDTWTKHDPQFNQKVANVNLSLAEYKSLWEDLLKEARGKPMLTLEYAFNRPPSQPETHDVRFVLGYAPQSALGMLSLNAAISLYGGTIPAGAKYGRLHDGQISTEYDRPLTFKNNPNQATFSLAAYWQYQPDPSVLNITAGNLAPGTNIDLPQNAQVLLGTAGSLWVTQAKLTINGKSGIKVPIAVRWANKTDLLVGNKIGAQVGISYDFSSLSSLFGGSTGQ